MSSTAVLGCMYGDEGKAKIVDALAENHDIVVRFQGGSNAGHTICKNGEEYVLHIIPSGILYPHVVCILGNGVVLDPFELKEEKNNLKKQSVDLEGRFYISPKANLVLPLHRELDQKSESSKKSTKIGTTKKGIGPCYSDKIGRRGIRAADLFEPEFLKERLEKIYRFHNRYDEKEIEALHKKLLATAEEFKPYMLDVAYYLDEAYKSGKNILFEGAQGTLLDIDFGNYPFVTSSHTVSGGITTGSGFPLRKVERIVGIYKSYFTRVGAGPMVTEFEDEVAKKIRNQGGEFGSTTGRPRRIGWFDAVFGRYSAMINGIDEIALTLVDVLQGVDKIKICTAYEVNGKEVTKVPASSNDLKNAKAKYIELPGWEEDISNIKEYDALPQKVKDYVDKVEELVGVKVKVVSVGPDRNQTIYR